jgi:hypothetical protein
MGSLLLLRACTRTMNRLKSSAGSAMSVATADSNLLPSSVGEPNRLGGLLSVPMNLRKSSVRSAMSIAAARSEHYSSSGGAVCLWFVGSDIFASKALWKRRAHPPANHPHQSQLDCALQRESREDLPHRNSAIPNAGCAANLLLAHNQNRFAFDNPTITIFVAFQPCDFSLAP